MTHLVKEQEQIIKIVSKYGCISIDQLELIMTGCQRKLTEMMVTQLVKRRYLEIVHELYIVCAGSADKFNKDTIDCIWVMLKLTKNPADLADVMQAANPSKFIFTVENKELFEIVPLSPTKVQCLTVIEDKVTARRSKSKHPLNNWYVFVVRKEETMQLIKEYDLDFPFVVAYLSNSPSTVKPDIRLMKKS